MAGSADELEVRISGHGAYLGENLAAQVADIAVSGAGEVKVWATKDLDGLGLRGRHGRLLGQRRRPPVEFGPHDLERARAEALAGVVGAGASGIKSIP